MKKFLIASLLLCSQFALADYIAPKKWTQLHDPNQTLYDSMEAACVGNGGHVESGVYCYAADTSSLYIVQVWDCPNGHSFPNGDSVAYCVGEQNNCTAGSDDKGGAYVSYYGDTPTVCINSCLYNVGNIASSASSSGGWLSTGDLHAQTGASCTGGLSASSATDSDECDLVNGSWGQVNGVDTCVPSSGSGNNTGTQSGTETGTQSGTETGNGNGDGTQSGTETGNGNGTGSQSGTGTGTGAGAGTTDEQQKTMCEVTPNVPACQNPTGSVKGQTQYTEGNIFYETQYPDGLAGVWNNAKSDIMNSGLGSAINSLMPNAPSSGAAPLWTFNFNFGFANFGSHTITTDSSLWAILRIIFLISTVFYCRLIVFGG